MQSRFVDAVRLSNVRAAHAPRRRIRHLLFAVVVTGLLSVGQVSAQDTEGSASDPASTPAAPNRHGKVCEYEVVTGSRMKKRVCYTPEQWAARERAGKELTRELNDRAIGRRDSE